MHDRPTKAESNLTLQLWEPKWKFPKQVEAWLFKYKNGRLTLHLPCGMSPFGDVRADIDEYVKPDIICDALHPPFRPGAFQLVVSDPPWKLFNKFKWIHALADLASDEFLLNCPTFLYRLKHFTMKIILVTRTNRPNIGIWISYKRKQKTLDKHL